jgi:hypothetical protein
MKNIMAPRENYQLAMKRYNTETDCHAVESVTEFICREEQRRGGKKMR